MNIDYSKIRLIPASLEKHPIIQNMARFYVYDMSEYMEDDPLWEIPSDGLFESYDFKKYWETSASYPFLIYYGDELAGFVIIDKKGTNPSIDFNMAQFFILKKFKGKGIGKFVAEKCFTQFPGSWELRVMPKNLGAIIFWRSIIKDFTNNCYYEEVFPVAELDNQERLYFKFNSNKR